ncbi:hypothetical protein AtubIFM57258_004726 [Aspergillus tubingensis]|nr:hypothetical protein AtubIFM57258_004726 [Aspergillus tubingensis]
MAVMGQYETPRIGSIKKSSQISSGVRTVESNVTKLDLLAWLVLGEDMTARGIARMSNESSSQNGPLMGWFTEPAEKLRLALLSDLQPPLERSQSSTETIEQCETSNPFVERTEAPDHSTTGSGPALTLQTSDAESSTGKQHDAGIVSRPTDLSTKLRAYYFSDTCRILSAYDSPTNPLREWVARLSSEHPVIDTCVLSISAAHLSQQQREMSKLAASHHTAALSKLAAEFDALDKQSPHGMIHPHLEHSTSKRQGLFSSRYIANATLSLLQTPVCWDQMTRVLDNSSSEL